MTSLCLAWSGTSRAEDDEAVRLRGAIGKALPLLQSSSVEYLKQRDCFSCHHQALPLLAFAAVKRADIAIPEHALTTQANFTRKYFAELKPKLREGKGVLGGAYSAGYALAGLEADGLKDDETSAALVSYLLKVQESDGGWRILPGSHRPPLEASHFTATALAVRALQRWKADEDRDSVKTAVERGVRWLQMTKTESTEDAALGLLGRIWGEDGPESVAVAVKDLLGRRRDAGWGQTPEMECDAYATGQALVALNAAVGRTKMLVDAEVLEQGRSKLVQLQRPDGSWFVKTRAKPFQEYFESGYPHGESQFISISAACWAVQALAEGLQKSTGGD